MTKKELRDKLISEAQAGWKKLNLTKRVCGSEFSYYDGYVDCGTIKEKQIQIDAEQIQIDAEQIRALQKQNGELTDELTKKADTNHQLVEQMAKLSEENGKLQQAMKQIHNLLYVYQLGKNELATARIRTEAEQFLKDNGYFN